MSNINNFFFDLTYAPGASERFQFFDVRALNQASNAESTQALLNVICSDPQLIDYSRPLTEDECLWLHLAAQMMFEDIQERVVEKNVPFKTAFAQVKSQFKGWQQLHSKISQSKPTSLASLKSILNAFPITCPEVKSGLARDFKNEVLFRNPENMYAENFNLMRRRVVDNVSQGSVNAILYEALSNNDRMLIVTTPRTAPLKGAMSHTLIGLNFTSDGSTDSPSGVLGATNKALVKADASLITRGVNLDKSVLKPTTQAQYDAIISAGKEAASDIIKDGDIGTNGAADLKSALDASIDVLLNDPTGPYSGKGYTKQEMISIATTGLFGVEGVSQMRESIAQGLQEALDQVAAAKFALDYAQSSLSANGEWVVDGDDIFADDPDPSDPAIVLARANLETAIENYRDLLSYSSALYEIDAPNLGDDGVRANPAPAAAVYVKVLLGVALATVIIFEILDRIEADRKRICKELADSAKSAHERLRDLILGSIAGATSTSLLDSVFAQIENANITADEKVLKEEGCVGGYKAGLKCRKTIMERWPTHTTFEAKKDELVLAARCLGAEAERLDKVVKDAEKRIKELEDRSVFRQFNNFLANIPKIGSSILTYAAYTALGLGVIWGAGKVYRALKSDDEG